MDRGYRDHTDYAAYGYDPQYYPNAQQPFYPPPYVYSGNPYSNQQYMGWHPGDQGAGQYPYNTPQGYHPQAQYYGEAAINYNNNYEMTGYEESQSGQTGENGGGQSRKYSYSQNRMRNRPRQDFQSNQADAGGAQAAVKGQDYSDTGGNIKGDKSDFDKENNIQNPEKNDKLGVNHDKDAQGSNQRSRAFNKYENYKDRRPNKYSNKSYGNTNNNYNSPQDDSASNSAEFNKQSGRDNSRASADSRHQTTRFAKSFSNQRYKDESNRSKKDNSKFQRPAPKQDSEAGKESIRNNEDGSGNAQKPKKYEKYSGDNGIENPDELIASDKAGNTTLLSKKKRKETYIYSSSGHRDGRNTNTQDTYNNQRSQNRFNYRGMDYNKRHKDESGLERGSERMKLSEKSDQNRGDTEKESGNDDQRKHLSGPNRGSRIKRQLTLDESQRGVLIEQLSKGSYECMVCCESVRSSNAVWSCANCYHVFHLRCIKRWAKSPNSVVSGAEKDGWRCPACQNLSFKFPNQYRCFCGKVKDPEMTRMDTPHSCGDVCKKNRGEGCKHPCNILCHPGPCPECNTMVTKSCDCGKTKQTVRCGQSTTIKCDSDCERLLNCGKHFCISPCHAGPCQKCDKKLTQDCYGEHECREVVCGSEESFTESYSCPVICGRNLDCGNHTCELQCHRGDCTSCPGLPSNVTHCPCGSTNLSELDTPPRTNCSDPIATCDNICNKLLDCGPPESKHRCQKTCHEGPCGPCDGETMLTCRCLFMDKKFKCSEITQSTDENGRFICDKRCNRKKACGRHKCSLSCCIKEEHPCEVVCGRKLPCGAHKCEEPCHRNNCPPCLMASFDELSCHCGAEVMFPPVPCGAKPPECYKPCSREHACNHQVRHNCHSEEKCPLCTELTKKWCMGRHVERTNIACHLQDISCGMKCSRPLSCREHTCQKICHKGDCLEEGQVCTQACRRKRESCDHVCGLPCHGEKPCPPSVCKAQITVKCACGHRESKAHCSFDESSEFQKITMQSLKESLMGGSSVSISKFNQGKLGSNRILECNEECAVIERNRRVALALEIQNPDILGKLGNPTYTDFLKDYARQNDQFVAGIEKALSELVQSAKQSKQPSRSHAFPSMNLNQRKVVHELSEFYGCETHSYDYEPNKNVVATAKRDKCWLPTVTLTTLVQREMHPRAPMPIPHAHKEEALRQSNQAQKQSTTVLRDANPNSTTTDGWHVMSKKTKKASSGAKSAIATIDRFEDNLSDICTSGRVDYSSLSKESKEALKSEPVVDYFDFTVN